MNYTGSFLWTLVHQLYQRNTRNQEMDITIDQFNEDKYLLGPGPAGAAVSGRYADPQPPAHVE